MDFTNEDSKNKRIDNYSWSDSEIEKLIELSKDTCVSDISFRLDIPIDSVMNKMKELGLDFYIKTNDPWEEKDINRLKELIKEYSSKDIAIILGRTISGIRCKIRKLGLSQDCNYYRPIPYWSKHEIKQLKSLAKDHTAAEVASVLKTRTKEAVLHKLKELKIDGFSSEVVLTEEEIQYLIDNYKTTTNVELANKFNVSVSIILRYAKKYNLSKDVGPSKWTDNVLEEFRKLAPTNTFQDLAKHFDTTVNSVKDVAVKYGIKVLDARTIWTDELIEKMIKLHEAGKNIYEIEKEIGMDNNAIKNKLNRLGYTINSSSLAWTEQEIDTLKEIYENNDANTYAGTKYDFLCYVHSLIPNRNISSIESRIYNLKLPLLGSTVFLSKEQIAEIKEIASEKTLVELMEMFKCTGRQLKKFVSGKTKSRLSPWTEEEDNELKELLKTKSVLEIAQKLNKTCNAVIERSKLFKVESSKTCWTKKDEDTLKKLWGKEPIEEIAKKLNRRELSVIYRANVMGLGQFRESNETGIKVFDIAAIFGISVNQIYTVWAKLGLNVKTVQVSKVSSYKYVEYTELLKFLQANVDVWDASKINPDYLEDLPNWVKEKAEKDKINKPSLTAVVQRRLRNK